MSPFPLTLALSPRERGLLPAPQETCAAVQTRETAWMKLPRPKEESWGEEESDSRKVGSPSNHRGQMVEPENAFGEGLRQRRRAGS